jgi:CheY-like chemotaxis protein
MPADDSCSPVLTRPVSRPHGLVQWLEQDRPVEGISSKCRILVVDDEPDLVKGLARILQTRGFEVYQAIGGCQAVELAKEHHPRVILTDIVMPDLDGIELSRRIRTFSPEAVIVFMTGFSDMEAQAGREGAAAVLRKPIDYPKLFELLETLRV